MDPHPQPQNSLLRIFRLQPGLERKFLLRRTWPGKKCSHCSFHDFHSLSKGNQVSLVRTFLSEPGSKSKISRLGGWGWKNDPDFLEKDAKRDPHKLFSGRFLGPKGPKRAIFGHIKLSLVHCFCPALTDSEPLLMRFPSKPALNRMKNGSRSDRGLGWFARVAACSWSQLCDCHPQLSGVSTPPSPEIAKKSRKGVPGPPGPECQKVSKKSPSTHIVVVLTLFRVIWDFFDTFLTLRAGRPGNTFSRLFGDFGARGRGDSCVWGLQSQSWAWTWLNQISPS